MGQTENTKHSIEEKHGMLKRLGKLPQGLDKDLSEYQPVDHHELALAFDEHLALADAPKAKAAPKDDEKSEEKAESVEPDFGGAEKKHSKGHVLKKKH